MLMKVMEVNEDREFYCPKASCAICEEFHVAGTSTNEQIHTGGGRNCFQSGPFYCHKSQ